MKILFLLTQDIESPSGLGRHHPMAKELVKLGHEIQIAALHPDFVSLERTKFLQDDVLINYVAPMHVRKIRSIKTHYNPIQLMFIVFRATLALTAAALRSKPDLIVVAKPHPMNSIAALIALTFRGVPFVLDCDDLEAGYGRSQDKLQRKVVSWFEKSIPRKASSIITNTRFNENRLKSLGIPEELIHYIPNGIDMDRFQSVNNETVKEIRRIHSPGNYGVIGYIGSINSPTHPAGLLIDIFVKVRQVLPNSILLIIGGGKDYFKVKSQIKDLNLEENIHLTGHIPPEEVPAYYRACDVIVEPVYDDYASQARSPLKLFESWISGVPFVTGDVGDRLELLGNPPAGVLVEPGNVEEYASAIIKLLSDKDRRLEISETGLVRAREFLWSDMSQEINVILTKSHPSRSSKP